MCACVRASVEKEIRMIVYLILQLPASAADVLLKVVGMNPHKQVNLYIGIVEKHYEISSYVFGFL